MSVAMVFPGQGSQSVGMLRELAAHAPLIERTLREAGDVLGYDLWTLTQNGPKEQLDRTEFTQAAMLAADVAVWRLWRQRGGAPPQFVSGHSLGEYAALVAADALTFADALRLVQFRGRAMQEAVPEGRGAIAAVIGCDDETVAAACEQAAAGSVVEPVNYNAPGQVVIAGEVEAVRRALEIAKSRGAKRAVVLPMSVPAHSSLMQPAAQRLLERLRGTPIERPKIRYFSAVDAAEHSEPDDIRAILGRQPACAVRWTETVRALLAAGVTRMIECGPGRVLTPMNKRADKRGDVQFLSVDDPASLDAALAL
ncbi:MAG: ACP S-malonyltransferase [Gammaproteobacteria bacterium]|nr:ACP S-malonyltransferase [Gammaproteobacteria bacterium]